MSEDVTSTIESIPVPPCPQVSNCPQTLKSSKEILCELFSAFNAKPPPLDDITSQDTKSTISDKSNKGHKKHTKKKHKKIKKKTRSSSGDSSSSNDPKKKSKKKHKKHKSKHKNLDSIHKKKKSKLKKFSASDSDSDDEPPRKKSNLIKKEKILNSDVTNKCIIKNEKQFNENSGTNKSTKSCSIQETILKHAVSKIVEKVIDSTNISSAPSIIKNTKVIHDSDDLSPIQTLCKTPSAVIKSEPTSKGKPSCLVLNIANPIPNYTFNEEETIPVISNKTAEKPVKEPLPVADVFAEDLLDSKNGTKNDSIVKTDKQKPIMGKITIKNLKFSQVYKETVKKIEEEAKLKAEKYEDGEISDSSVEQERSPTPSEISNCGSVREIDSNEKRSVKRRKSHKHHKSKERHRHKRQDKKRSLSREGHRSPSPSHRHYSHHHRDRYKERSKNGTRDLSRDKTRDRSRDRVGDRSRSRSRERRNSRERGSSWDRSRSKEKHKSKDVYDVNEKKRSHEKNKHSHSHSNEKNKRNSEEKIDKQKLLEIARRNALNMMKTPVGVTDQTKVTITAGGKTVNELTDFCKQLSKKEADGHESISSNTEHSSDSESEKAFHHPFQIRDRSNIVLNIRNSVALPVKSHQEKTAEQSRQLRLQFPVSSGQQHRKTESEWVPVSPKKTEAATPVTVTTNSQVAIIKPIRQKRVFKDTPDPPKVDIGSIVSQRLEAMRKLQENPMDSEALSQMHRAQQHMKTWAESKQETGQFTGTTGVKVLSQAELSSGYQAWARKDQLQAAAPVTSGMGMALLQKMGWRPGEGLGKNKEGTLQPLLLEVKMDKKGLVAQEELPIRQPNQVIKGPPRKITSLEGKHPVSLLNEYCSRRRYGPPLYDLVDEAGPDHKKNFLFKVKVNGVEYKPAVGSPKKKQARAEAAEVCLKALGVLPNK